MHDATTRKSISGATLLDELLSVVVLSIGLLGLAGLQGRVMGIVANAETQSAALSLAESRLEHLRGIAAAPGSDAGYASIAEASETVTAVGGARLDAPITLRTSVARYRLQPSGDGQSRYLLVRAGDAPVQADVPEFKRVTITATWTSRSGAVQRLALPGLVSPGGY
jgi:Tfp pilus assembly protein PilV